METEQDLIEWTDTPTEDADILDWINTPAWEDMSWMSSTSIEGEKYE